MSKNRILSIGNNHYYKTHPKAAKMGCFFNSIHSELDAFVRYKGDIEDLRRCKIINTRINSKDAIGYSKPCEHCLPLLEKLGFKEIWYTTNNGFEKL